MTGINANSLHAALVNLNVSLKFPRVTAHKQRSVQEIVIMCQKQTYVPAKTHIIMNKVLTKDRMGTTALVKLCCVRVEYEASYRFFAARHYVSHLPPQSRAEWTKNPVPFSFVVWIEWFWMKVNVTFGCFVLHQLNYNIHVVAKKQSYWLCPITTCKTKIGYIWRVKRCIQLYTG